MKKKTLNLTNSNYSDIKFKIHQFPDGHDHLEILEPIGKEKSIDIITRVVDYNDIFILKQIKDICDVNEVRISKIKIVYLLAARMDRRMSLLESFDLKVILNDLISICESKINPISLEIVDIHSDVSKKYIKYEDIFTLFDLKYNKHLICFPDKGAKDRLYVEEEYRRLFSFTRDKADEFSEYCDRKGFIECSKVRDPKTNQLSGFEIKKFHKKKRNNKGKNKSILVVDDLCDGGGTFVGIAEKLRELKPSKLILFVTHAIQLKGIEKVAEIYDEVIITNSYFNWENIELPKNVKVINICK